MNKKVLTFLSFIAGATIGGGTSYILTKKKYESIMNDTIESEIESVRTKYNEMAKDLAERNVIQKEVIMKTMSEPIQKEDNDISEVIESYSPTEDDERPGIKLTEVKTFGKDKPYIISADEYGTEYDPKSLNYYTDGVLTEDMMVDGKYEEHVIDNIDAVAGIENLQYDEKYRPEVIYVRNDEKYSDYEIIFVDNDYEDADD